MQTPDDRSAAFRSIFRRAHAGHPACLGDPWLTEPCRTADGTPVHPVVWSRRNGPWRRHAVLWVGAAPGNAGGLGKGDMGAHGTRIPFGGDVAGANLDVLMGSIGLDRNRTFITAALNQLPEAGGGEPRTRELAAPVGEHASSVHLLQDTILAVAPRLIVMLGNVALRATIAAAQIPPAGDAVAIRLPGLRRLRDAGLRRGVAAPWPADLPPSPAFGAAWRETAGPAPLPALVWVLHPSAQNMSPHAGTDTAFHRRMIETRDALRAAVKTVLNRDPPDERPAPPRSGIYALPEWVDRVEPRHGELDALWREKSV